MLFRVITKIRAVALYTVLIAVTLSLFSCSPITAPKTEYAKRAFRAEIRWVSDGSEYRAELVARGISSDSDSRQIELAFTSPERLCGVIIEKVGEKATVKVGDMVAELHNQAILEAAELVASDGSFSYKAKAELSGREVIVAERVCENDISEIYIDRESGAPLLVVSGERRIDVVWFEFLD